MKSCPRWLLLISLLGYISNPCCAYADQGKKSASYNKLFLPKACTSLLFLKTAAFFVLITTYYLKSKQQKQQSIKRLYKKKTTSVITSSKKDTTLDKTQETFNKKIDNLVQVFNQKHRIIYYEKPTQITSELLLSEKCADLKKVLKALIFYIKNRKNFNKETISMIATYLSYNKDLFKQHKLYDSLIKKDTSIKTSVKEQKAKIEQLSKKRSEENQRWTALGNTFYQDNPSCLLNDWSTISDFIADKKNSIASKTKPYHPKEKITNEALSSLNNSYRKTRYVPNILINSEQVRSDNLKDVQKLLTCFNAFFNFFHEDWEKDRLANIKYPELFVETYLLEKKSVIQKKDEFKKPLSVLLSCLIKHKITYLTYFILDNFSEQLSFTEKQLKDNLKFAKTYKKEEQKKYESFSMHLSNPINVVNGIHTNAHKNFYGHLENLKEKNSKTIKEITWTSIEKKLPKIHEYTSKHKQLMVGC